MSSIFNIDLSRNFRLMLLLFIACGLAACGGGGYGGSSYNGGGYSSSSYSSSSASSSSSVVASTQLSLNLDSKQIVSATSTSSSSSTSAAASITFDAAGMMTGSVTLTGVTATTVTLNDAFAGNNGAMVLSFTQSSTNVNMWNLTGTLNANQLTDLQAGKMYLLVATSAAPQGALRGQILPAGVTVICASLSGDQEVPSVTSSMAGTVAVTVNTITKKAAVNLNLSVNNASGAELLTGSSSTNGMSLATLVADNAVAGHWWNENVTLTDADIANYNSSKWYVNVNTNAHASGEVRAQIAQTPPTLAQLQVNIFSAKCAGCHNGTGTILPGVQNLTSAANTFAALVNVPSIEQNTLMKIKPSDPDNSYLIRKVEGDASITGSRMPLGGQLSQAEIDQLRAWVTAGAPNN